jgi:hypothetical protein
MSKVKKQHYVPQYYLRQFADDNGLTHVYDKFQQSQFRANIRDVASDTYFYDLSQDYIEELEERIRAKQSEEGADEEKVNRVLQLIKNTQIIEQHLSRLEARSATILDKVIEDLEKGCKFRRKYRWEIAMMAALQYWRTYENRETMKEMAQKIELGVMRIVNKMNEAKGTNFTAEDIGVVFNPNRTEDLHKLFVYDMNRIVGTATVFNHHIWLMGVNETNEPLCTSDNPVATRPHITNEWYSNSGIASRGIEITFPLNPKYIVIMCERDHFRREEHRDNKVTFLNEENITYYNCLQVYSSYRQLYSPRDNFQLVETMCQDNLMLKFPQARVEINE